MNSIIIKDNILHDPERGFYNEVLGLKVIVPISQSEFVSVTYSNSKDYIEYRDNGLSWATTWSGKRIPTFLEGLLARTCLKCGTITL